jgi:hypothetical protein
MQPFAKDISFPAGGFVFLNLKTWRRRILNRAPGAGGDDQRPVAAWPSMAKTILNRRD